MSSANEKTLDNKRIEVIDNLISATQSGRIEWEATGDGGYYAQPNAMGVRVNQRSSTTNILNPDVVLELYIFDSQGNSLDDINTRIGKNEHLYNKINTLIMSIKEHEESNVARDLDRFLEDLRA